MSKVGGYNSMQSKHAGMRHTVPVLKQALFIAHNTCIDLAFLVDRGKLVGISDDWPTGPYDKASIQAEGRLCIPVWSEKRKDRYRASAVMSLIDGKS